MKQRILMTALAAAAMTACGGGGDGGSDPQSTSITLSGTAATGAAIVGGQVDVKCAAGSGSATTLADGTYSVTVSGATLPCVLRVTSGSTVLYSLAEEGSGSTVHANITPFSHMVTAKAVGGDLDAFYTSFDVSDQAKLDSSTVASAITAVTETLSGTATFAGVNPITGSFVIGDAFDQQLDAFQAALAAAQVSLDDVTSAVVAGGSTTAPAQTILRPAASSCAGLRSGKYRLISPHEAGHDADYVANLITVDAAALTVTDDLDEEHTPMVLTPDVSAGCRFTMPEDDTVSTWLVSTSGLGILHAPTDGGKSLASFALPEQSVPVTELAGTWNYLVYERSTNSTPFTTASGTLTMDATGQITARTNCTALDVCEQAQAPFSAWVVNPDGGFDEGSSKRGFAFKTASGAVSLFQINKDNGSILIATKQVALSLPAIGQVSTFTDFTININGFASALDDSTVTVTAVDAEAQSFTRTRSADGRIDSLTINDPRNGLRYRPLGTSPVDGGGTVNVSETITLQLPGTGASVFLGRSSVQGFFGVSINKP